MNRSRDMVLLVPLLSAALAVAACAKKPVVTPSGSAGVTGSRPSGGATAAPGTGAAVAPSAITGGGAAGTGGSPGSASTGTLAGAGTTLPALPSPREYVENPSLSEIHFDFDRYGIRRQDKDLLGRNAEWLKAHTAALLLIEGHADERGTSEYNLALGERRAKAARDYLAGLGVDGGRITIISYGEERPVCTDRNESCWANNRRAHFLVKP
ncbi:MAG: peptidoglycan-associated lipoprotein Pal [Candidatus Rokubacteria bacterium]|nr:peptidoglycan-associated lipoprotein Pal [Candidatus Rokubacteria bacterium]